MASIHQFKVEGIDGKVIDFADFKGKKMMVVNVASECGYTPQYQQLQELYEEFYDKFVIIGFPSNDFGKQEPGTNEEIKAFCSTRYRVKFPMAAKTSVKGENKHPVYQWLTGQAPNASEDHEVKWNFQKYLLDETGQLIATHPSSVSPIDEVVLDWIAG